MEFSVFLPTAAEIAGLSGAAWAAINREHWERSWDANGSPCEEPNDYTYRDEP